ncbi:MAG: ABC transporter permease [Gemmatimonadota bacterium]
MRHLKLAVRMLLKTPFVTTVAILSLALGIGANAAIYSLFDQLLMRPLPVPQPGQLVNLGAPGPKPGSQSCSGAGSCDDVFSYPMFRDLERLQTVFTGVAAHRGFGASLSVNNEPVSTQGMLVTGSYFPTLQVQPALGRLLTPADDEKVGANFVTVLSHDFWRDKLGSNPKVVGSTITLNGNSFTVVGVAPSGFRGTTLGDEPSVFVPISMRGIVSRGFNGFENRRQYWMYVFGRLKPGVTMEQAARTMNGVYKPILTDVEAPLQTGMSDQTLKNFKAKSLTLVPGARGQSSIHTEAKTPLLMLFAITGVVLLIACANIANLLLARGANRAMEMGVRLALGAGRGQLLLQLLVESMVLALVGGAVSLVIAKLTLLGIGSLMPPDASQTISLTLQPRVVAFTAVLAVVTGILFGMFPALHSTRSDLITVIRAGAGQITGGRTAARFRAALVTVQIALSMALLISAGLFLKSLRNVSRVDLGVNVDQVVTFSMSPTRIGYDSTKSAVLFNQIEQEMAALPGVTGVTSALVPLLAGDSWGTSMRVQGFECGPDTDCGARFNEVGADYLKNTGMQLVDGREFTVSDRAGATRVAIVNEEFARKFNLGRNAVGKFVNTNGNDTLNVQIVGLMKNAKYNDVKDTIPPLIFLPWRQNSSTGNLNFYVRSSLPPEQLLTTIPAVLKRIDPNVPIENVKTMPQQIRENVFLDRMISILSASFAVLATLLAGVGLYGVLAYTVSQRTREIGVRMALGADAARVRRLVMRQMSGMMLIGGVVGIVAAIGLGRAARSLLFELEGHDPLVFVLSVLMLAAVAMLAGWLPARRAAQTHPMQALRYD